MKNIVLITKIDSVTRTKIFLDLNTVKAVELSNSDQFMIYLDNEIWYLPIEEFEYVMNYWKKDYRTMKQYQDYINS